jgi:TorA maturation chaperone TorD
MSGTQPLTFQPTLPPEEVARANFYGLLARLYYAPPDAMLLEAITGADEIEAEDGGIATAWRDLARAAADADPEALREEYDNAFIGTGKAPVTLYSTAYSIKYSNEAPLAELRADLAAMGLGRRNEASEPEDHIAALFDVMRLLIAEQESALETQRRFFARWIWPTVEPLCSAIDTSPHTGFYRVVARFTKCFLELEHAAFEML